ncbi:restriction endonuclease subunit S [uncultured Trichococcus sp.]|uniref:restriction endonuclease subunit S n=1 Tax=uncultured Trichococcus sp. TaxID=189665 RepID=UPI002A18B24B|nr:restriction endonuclease subunit S [uncultured Trichococcus sp.]
MVDWKQRKLGDHSQILTGGTPKTQIKEYWEPKEIPWMSSGEINKKRLFSTDNQISKLGFENSSARWIKENSVLIALAGQGKTRGTVAINEISLTSNQSIAAIEPDDTLDSGFLFQNLGKRYEELRLASSGDGSRGGLNKQIISDIKIIAPSIKEQNTVGSFFKHLDDTIALHQRKLNLLNRLKQTYMNALFPQNDENIPVLRFVVFSEPWEQRALKEVSERVRGNDGRMNLPTLTISAGSGWLDQRERFSGNIAGNEQKNYTLLSKGELSYNHGNSKLAKYGTVFALRTYNEALVPRVYHSFRTTDEASADFVEFMFSTKRPDRELAKLVSSGARMDGLLNINYDDFSEINIMIPKIDEQNRISDFLRKFDETITLQQQKIDNMKTLKSILLDKMFI